MIIILFLYFLMKSLQIPEKWVRTDDFEDPDDGKFYAGKVTICSFHSQ